LENQSKVTMKALFKSHFPFVEGTPEEELDSSQKLIKQTYEKLYPDSVVSGITDSKKKTRQHSKSQETETNRLREVHANERPSEGSGE